MLMPKKRFRFNHMYVYGSAAFILGFGTVMATIVHIAPVKVPNSHIATTAEVPKTDEVIVETTNTSEGNGTDDSSAQTNTTSRGSTRSGAVSTPSAPSSAPADTETPPPVAPVDPTPPIVTEEPEVIPDPDPVPIVDIPGVELTLDL